MTSQNSLDHRNLTTDNELSEFSDEAFEEASDIASDETSDNEDVSLRKLGRTLKPTTHATLEAAIQVIEQHAKQHGYGITRCKVVLDKRTPPTPRRYDYRCAKGGIKRGEGVKRKTATRMTECPFKVRIKRLGAEEWQVFVDNALHNHDTSHPSNFAKLRRPHEEEKVLIRSLHASGTAPRFIVAALIDRDPQCLMSLRDGCSLSERASRFAHTY